MAPFCMYTCTLVYARRRAHLTALKRTKDKQILQVSGKKKSPVAH